MSANDFGARVLRARLSLAAKRGRPVTQGEIAEALGVKAATISRYESGVQEPTLAVIESLAGILEVDPRWLAFGDPEPAAAPPPAPAVPVYDANPDAYTTVTGPSPYEVEQAEKARRARKRGA